MEREQKVTLENMENITLKSAVDNGCTQLSVNVEATYRKGFCGSARKIAARKANNLATGWKTIRAASLRKQTAALTVDEVDFALANTLNGHSDSAPQEPTPLYRMSIEQECRYFSLSDRLRSLGYFVRSEPLVGEVEGWLDGIAKNIARIEAKLIDINKAYRTRGRSKVARYYLTSNDRFDPGFGIALTHDQRQENIAYAAQIARRNARWNADFWGGVEP